MTYDDAVAALYRLRAMSVRLGLDNINRILDRLGRPEDCAPFVHVAGTNGKGSVVAILASILTASGYRTGRTTSPHLADYRERICVDGRPIGRTLVTRFVRDNIEYIRDYQISFFESTIALAFWSFARTAIDRGVVEVGMGGRLDATNAIRRPALTIITNIERDHTRSLGRTRARIAAEKAGIIKPGVPVLVGGCTDAVRQVLHRHADVRQSPFHTAHEVLAATLRHSAGLLPRSITTPLCGPHQRENIRTAIAAALLLRQNGGRRWRRITSRSIADGIARTHWPGRFQRTKGRPPVYYDVAHNRGGSLALAHTVRQHLAGRPLAAVAACRAERGLEQVLRPLRPLVDRWFLCRLPDERGHTATGARRVVRALDLDGTWIADPPTAVARAADHVGTRGAVLVFGSHFLVGDIIPVSLLAPTWRPDPAYTETFPVESLLD